MKRDGDFTNKTKRILSERVNGLCSNCFRPTTGPHDSPSKSTISGQAAHIHSASQNGPRFDKKLSLDEVRSPENGIWLCGSCHTIIDRNESSHTAEELRILKAQAETKAAQAQLLRGNPNKVSTRTIKERWVHETTDDSRYVRREGHLSTLNSWMADIDTKIIAITGIGGQGKTSLVGNWLKYKDCLQKREIEGLFYWSFYNEIDVNVFFQELLAFCKDSFITLPPTLFENQSDVQESIRQVLSIVPICVILDGLEVIQSDKSEYDKGQFLSADLRHFLLDFSLSPTNSIAVLTSRFDIVDLRPRDEVVKYLRLTKLNEFEACSLLKSLYVGGARVDLQRISTALEGHPLALKVFAAGLPNAQQMSPISHLNRILSVESQIQISLDDKIVRLLSYYEKTLTNEQVSILSSVSTLSSTIDEKTLISLSETMSNNVLSSKELQVALSSLINTGLIIQDIVKRKVKYSCHPIIRDYFRHKITSDSSRGNLVGSFLANKPGRGDVVSSEMLEYIVSAIEILASSGSWFEASDLYDSKLKGGMTIRKLSSPEAGWRCCRALTKSAPNNPALYSSIWNDHDKFNTLVVYHNSSGQFSKDMGDIANAISCYKEAIDILSKKSQKRNEVTTLMGLAQVYIECGNISKSTHYLSLSMNAANERVISEELKFELYTTRAKIHLLCGEYRKAEHRLAYVMNRTKPHPRSKHKTVSNPDARALAFMGLVESALLQGDIVTAEGLQKSSIPYVRQSERLDIMLMSMYWQGYVSFQSGDFELAESTLLLAERLARKANMEYWLIQTNILQSELYYCQNEKPKALLTIDNCINVTSSRQFDSLYVDALITKARIIGQSDANEASQLLTKAEQMAITIQYQRAISMLSITGE
ncbi:hypothetical protein [Vibrio sp. THAF190c]|uniref:hypothetical protein n=1 Tax=Vibrio sp. THAF190c TaxID=2587865 RepID=UPI001268FCF9|nr:hypothetical protein [Vibrio sp. THAF190c]QFT11222.1 hypothetical protein FIV04_14960 [Vibrio sp. THAF190c]